MTPQQKTVRTSRWEWVTALVSGLLLLGILGVLLYDALARAHTPPDIVVRPDSSTRGAAGFRVHFTARNLGHETAAAVHVSGEILEGEAPIESAEAVLDYVPGNGKRSGQLVFTRDPRAHRLDLRARGHAGP